MNTYSFKQRILVIAVILNAVIFFLLSMLHFYWAFGGKLWYDEVLPTNSTGLNKMNPSTPASLIIASVLLFFALITIGNQGLFYRFIKKKYFRYGNLIIAIIFFIRAVGDFKFIGFFKTIKTTRFGINDTQIFSPLCIIISLLSLLIFIFNKNKP